MIIIKILLPIFLIIMNSLIRALKAGTNTHMELVGQTTGILHTTMHVEMKCISIKRGPAGMEILEVLPVMRVNCECC